MAQKTRAPVKPPEPPNRASQQPARQPQRKMSADTPMLRRSGASIVGLRLSPRGKLTPVRMRRILRALALTPTQYNAWSGFTLPEYIAANPSWTERQWFELIQENYPMIESAA